MTPIVDKEILTADVVMQNANLMDLLQDHEKFFSTVTLTDSNGQRTKRQTVWQTTMVVCYC